MTTPRLTHFLAAFEALRHAEGLEQLDQDFLDYLNYHQSAIYVDLMAYRQQKPLPSSASESDFLIALAPYIEEFLTKFFQISNQVQQLKLKTLSHNPIFAFKQMYVQRLAKRRLGKGEDLISISKLNDWLFNLVANENDKELAIASLGINWLANEASHVEEIERLVQWCIYVLQKEPHVPNEVYGWVTFKLPQKLDYDYLVPVEKVNQDPYQRYQGNPEHFRNRDGFALTDTRATQREALDEVHYCVYCHKNQGDFCSRGFPVKKGESDHHFKTNPLGEILTGCPLDEKISEMHALKRDGYSIAALAMVMRDNPMCPATGHRICNDCMKSCIYQKQDPVDIPQTETRILTDVLDLDWGVEIYDLLTRWNPLRSQQYISKPYTGNKVLVMGMGPAGFTLAHHLLMEGFAVVGADGLKIEPLAESLLNQPIKSYQSIKENLDERVMTGFGGVAEYGITVRWDKNFLKLIYLTLARRPYFQVFGNVRFGGTLLVENVWELGFDHLAVAVGAGLPKELAIPGSLAPGMRQANDFLMALQLTGAAKKTSLANLQVRLPAVVIGGGLTGVDTATEVQAYYIQQVEKIFERYTKLAETFGEARVRSEYDNNNLAILDEFLDHAKKVKAERELAKNENRPPDFISLVRAFGGVTIVYRGLMRESPAYRLNHEELSKAFEEGIYYAEGLIPKAALLDEQGFVKAMTFQSGVLNENQEWILSDETMTLPARSVFIATGAKPNIAYEFEHKGTFHREGFEYQVYQDEDGELKPVHFHDNCKSPNFGAFTSYQKDDYRVTFLGDTHPVFRGSVVKAIASAKRIYPKILNVIQAKNNIDKNEYRLFADKISGYFHSSLLEIKRLNANTVEFIVQNKLAAQNYQPGQFFRIQNYEMLAKEKANTILQTESIALEASHVDKTFGIIHLIGQERGASTRILSQLEPGQPVALMGPTGVRTRIPESPENILIIGGSLAAIYVLSISEALKAVGAHIVYLASFKNKSEIFSVEALEKLTDKIIWQFEAGENLDCHRPQDRSYNGAFSAMLMDYALGNFELPGEMEFPLSSFDRIYLIDQVLLIREFQRLRKDGLQTYFKNEAKFFASVYAPMQCMLKGVCAQCLVWQIDPTTGKRKKAVFACSWHNQPLEMVDLNNLEERLAQNRMQEILSDQWVDYLFTQN